MDGHGLDGTGTVIKHGGTLFFLLKAGSCKKKNNSKHK
jgi:hypothetical protein